METTPAVTRTREIDLILRETFFGNPDRSSVTVSRDGRYLAYLAPHNGVMNVWVESIAGGSARPVTAADRRPIRSYFWAHNNEQIVYVQDKAGDENWRLYAVDIEGGAEVELTPFDGVQARVVATDRDHPDEILAAINNRVPQFHDVVRINTRTGARELVFQNDEGWTGFVADATFALRVVTRVTPDGGELAMIRDTDDGDWRELAHWSMTDSMSSHPIGFARDNETLYLSDSRNADTAGLYAAKTGDDGSSQYELIARDDRADLYGAIQHPETGRLQAVSFQYKRVEWKILDEAISDDWQVLRGVADGDFTITSRSADDSKWTVAYTVDDGPVRYYLYDRLNREPRFLFVNQSALEGKTLATMKPVIINSRDGLELVSYLTTPPGMIARDLPMVLLVHGGPWGRDSWGYHAIHQWLANRGYAVLSVNFRGSTGFGKSFINAANREWSGRMHDDLIDGVGWAVDQGIADESRVAIMGGSYGGYAALVGMTFTPDVFAAGVSIVGPSHIRTLLESIPPYWEPIKAMFEKRVGGLDETGFLDRISPLTHVEQIRRPLLIGQGANDPRVKEAESEQIVAAMQERNIPVTYVVFPDEGHGFARPENSIAFWAVTEAFLAKYLGGRYEPIGEAIGASTATVPNGATLVPGLNEAIGD